MLRISALALLVFILSTPAMAQMQDSREVAAQKQAEADAKAASAELSRIAQENGWRNDPFYASLTVADNSGGAQALRDTLTKGIEAGGTTERQVGVQWLIDHTFGLSDRTKFNVLYFLYLVDLESAQAQVAQAIGRMEDYNKAGFLALRALMTYELVAQADAERCDDPTVAEQINKDVASRYQDLRWAFRIPSKEDYDVASFHAVDIESDNNDRAVNLMLCRSGEKGRADPNYTPKPLLDWLSRRTALRIQYKTMWSEQFYTMRATPKATTANTPATP
ncbi:MAG TPA: hypothetical protein VEF76_13685 [Patescibacteria group bacterium]|nr:hypothetical protein [Patescibacteria group bacterium]